METTIAILLRKIAAAPNYLSVQTNLSEELKLNIIKCVEATYRRSTSDVIEQFYGKQNLNVIAQSLSITENILSSESYRPLRYEQTFSNLSIICDRVIFFFFRLTARIAAIKCMMSIFQVNDDADESDIVLRHHIADNVFLLIPKIIKTLCNIATMNETHGELLIIVSEEIYWKIQIQKSYAMKMLF